MRWPAKDIPLASVGPVWLLRTLGELEATASVVAEDGFVTCTFSIEKGRLVQARAKTGDASSVGAQALASLVGLSGGVASVAAAPPSGRELTACPWLLDELALACRRAAQAEQRILEATVRSAGGFSVDDDLYRLYMRVASDRDVLVAKALCEERVDPTRLAEHLKLPEVSVRDALCEMVRRNVIAPLGGDTLDTLPL